MRKNVKWLIYLEISDLGKHGGAKTCMICNHLLCLLCFGYFFFAFERLFLGRCCTQALLVGRFSSHQVNLLVNKYVVCLFGNEDIVADVMNCGFCMILFYFYYLLGKLNVCSSSFFLLVQLRLSSSTKLVFYISFCYLSS